jgi:hypothetical protein
MALVVRMARFQRALADFRLSIMWEPPTEVAETHWDDMGSLRRLLDCADARRGHRRAIAWPASSCWYSMR